jgi:CBS-domain-containing membrane protein
MNARLRHEIVWAPLGVAALIAAIGLAGLLFKQPLLFASLGPTAYLLVHSPTQPAAKPFNVIVGHLIALSTAFIVTALTGAADAPSVFVTHELVLIRVVCSAVALGLAVVMELLMEASHPPAAATVLLITLGGFPPSLLSAVIIMVGVALLCALGEPVRRLRLRQT